MAYTAQYSTADFRSIVVDILGSAGNEVVQWVGMLVLLTILGVFIKRVGKLNLNI